MGGPVEARAGKAGRRLSRDPTFAPRSASRAKRGGGGFIQPPIATKVPRRTGNCIHAGYPR